MKIELLNSLYRCGNLNIYTDKPSTTSTLFVIVWDIVITIPVQKVTRVIRLYWRRTLESACRQVVNCAGQCREF